MKKTASLVGTVVIVLLTSHLLTGQQSAKDPGSPLGTWRLISTKYGDAKEFSDVTKDDPHLKMLTSTHFIWVIYDAKTKMISGSMGGGPYTLHGGTYTETVDFYYPAGMEAYLGKKQIFTIKIEGDRLLQSGKLSDGQNIEEVWQRVK